MSDNFEMDDMLKEFLDESGELLYVLNRNLLQLEADEGDSKKLLNEMFRSAHSIKGMAGMMDLEKMAELTHKIENILDALRQEKIILNQDISDVFFKSFDYLEEMLGYVANGDKIAIDISEIVSSIRSIIEKYGVSPESDGAVLDNKSETKTDVEDHVEEPVFSADNPEPVIDKEKYKELYIDETNDEIDRMTQALLKLECDIKNKSLLNEIFRVTHRIKSSSAALGFSGMSSIAHHIENILDGVRQEKLEIEEAIVTVIFKATDMMMKIIQGIKDDSHGKINISEILNMLNKYIPPEEDETESGASLISEDNTIIEKGGKESSDSMGEEDNLITRKDEAVQTLRVDLDKLDELMNLSSEIIIEKARLLRTVDQVGDYMKGESGKIVAEHLGAISQKINRLSIDIQLGVMQARMVPVKGLFRRFGRVVRDIASMKGKKITLDIIGEETELDKKIVDELGDPLTHLVRNAADHGIEVTRERIEKGKSEIGVIKLKAYHEASSICIEVMDDGQGMDVEVIKRKAILKGLIEKDQENLSREDLLNLVFTPGFSTAKEVTETSGRGVGLDVVKDKIEQLNGSVSIDTTTDKGTCFVLRVPLTLAIISCVLTRIGEDIFSFPIDSISEIIQVDINDMRSIRGNMAITHRDMVLPIVYLHDILSITARPEEGDRYRVLVVNSQNKYIGIIVDSLIGREEITIKSLAENLKQVPGIMGASILGNGRVCLIVDIAGLFKMATKTGVTRIKNEMEVNNI